MLHAIKMHVCFFEHKTCRCFLNNVFSNMSLFSPVCYPVVCNGGSRMGHLGQMPPPPPPPSSPFGGIILQIKIYTKLYVRVRSINSRKQYANFSSITNSPESKQTKVKLVVKLPPAPLCVLSTSKPLHSF